MHKAIKYILIANLLLPGVVIAQLPTNIVVQEESSITQAIKWYQELNQQNKYIEGWTVQIISTRDRRKMEKERDQFLFQFPELKIRQSFTEPYYRLKVGSFISKLDALALRSTLQKHFESSVLVKENILKEDYF